MNWVIYFLIVVVISGIVGVIAKMLIVYVTVDEMRDPLPEEVAKAGPKRL